MLASQNKSRRRLSVFLSHQPVHGRRIVAHPDRASAGYAQDDVRKRGDKACGGDSRKMCSKFFGQGDMAVLGCLQQNKVRLSGNCRKFLTEIGSLLGASRGRTRPRCSTRTTPFHTRRRCVLAAHASRTCATMPGGGAR